MRGMVMFAVLLGVCSLGLCTASNVVQITSTTRKIEVEVKKNGSLDLMLFCHPAHTGLLENAVGTHNLEIIAWHSQINVYVGKTVDEVKSSWKQDRADLLRRKFHPWYIQPITMMPSDSLCVGIVAGADYSLELTTIRGWMACASAFFIGCAIIYLENRSDAHAYIHIIMFALVLCFSITFKLRLAQLIVFYLTELLPVPLNFLQVDIIFYIATFFVFRLLCNVQTWIMNKVPVYNFLIYVGTALNRYLIVATGNFLLGWAFGIDIVNELFNILG